MPTDGNDRRNSVDSAGAVDKGEARGNKIPGAPDAWEYEGAEDVDVPIPFRCSEPGGGVRR